MKIILLLAATAALAGCDQFKCGGQPCPAPKQSIHEPTDDGPPLKSIGKTQALTGPGVSMIVGPATVRGTSATIPLWVKQSPPMNDKKRPAFACLFLDEHGDLVGSATGIVPPAFHGATVEAEIGRPVNSVRCQLGDAGQ